VSEGLLLLVVGALLLGGVLIAFASSRAGVPALVGFLGLGMLLGSEGIGGIAFDDAHLARTVGVAALAVILFEGGLTTSWSDVRGVLLPAGMLATVGVVVTAGVTGAAAYLLFDLSLTASFLLGAIVASTDAAAVFLTLRTSSVRRRLAGLLEVESGTNDPVAVALTLGLIGMLTAPDEGVVDLLLFLARQLAIGAAVGLALGWAASWAVRRATTSMAPFAAVASLAGAALSFGAADVLGGSGFLAIYLVGLCLGNTPNHFRGTLRSFHEGLAYLAQVSLFVVLGLLVFPSDLPPVALSGVALAAVLILVARPLGVLLSLAGQRFKAREVAFVSWAGLRGAVPIVLATFAATEGLSQRGTIFNAVFFVVLVSAFVQGTTLEPLARRLGLTTERPALSRPPIEVGAVQGADLIEYEVREGHAVAGRRVRELGLPRAALVAVIVREEQAVPPRGSTRVEAGDRLYVLLRNENRKEMESLMRAWEEGPLPGPADGAAPDADGSGADPVEVVGGEGLPQRQADLPEPPPEGR
jgi:cell volume regulation protein A